MKRTIFIIATLFCVSSLKSQEIKNPNLASMIQSERDFSLTAKESDTRQAFLSFTNEESLGFNNGPVSLKKEWEQRKADSSWLWWEPDYADIASSGDFGFTSGSWEYRKNRTDVKALAQGLFFTIWKKDASGIWKVLIDMGISYNDEIPKTKLSTSAIFSSALKYSTGPDVLTFDKDLFGNLSTGILDRYDKVLSLEARFYQSQNRPFIGKKSIIDHISGREPVSYSAMGSFLAKSGDMGVVYGSAILNPTDSVSFKKANYLRIWKKENGSTWKLVVEVVE